MSNSPNTLWKVDSEALRQKIGKYSPGEMEIFYRVLTTNQGINRHSSVPLQLQAILTATIGNPELLRWCVIQTETMISPLPDFHGDDLLTSWNDEQEVLGIKREIDGEFH